jgi:hypothetical protein
MAETQRSIATLQTLLADNTSGDISPTDLRDLMETLRNGHGEIYVTASAATSFTDTTSFVDVAGTFGLVSGAYSWSMPSNGQLTYGNTNDRVAVVTATLSLSSTDNGQVVELALAKTGSTLTHSVIQRKIVSAAEVGAAAVQATTTVTNGDYFTLQVKNTSWTAAETVTVELASITAVDIAK